LSDVPVGGPSGHLHELDPARTAKVRGAEEATNAAQGRIFMPENVETRTAAEITEGKGTSRRQFMGYLGLTGAGAALVACSPTPTPQPGQMTEAEKRDLSILNYALTLEYLEADFYNQFTGDGINATKLSNAQVKEYAREIAAHENAHVAALKATITKLGGTPVAKPTFDFGPLIGSKTVNDELFLALAATFEPIGVRAYLGQVAQLTNPELVATAGAIHAVEANHVSAVQELRVALKYNKTPERQTDIAPQSDAKPTSLAAGDFDADYSPTPTALWKELTMDQVLEIVKPVIK
jgi:rubrerythrin